MMSTMSGQHNDGVPALRPLMMGNMMMTMIMMMMMMMVMMMMVMVMMMLEYVYSGRRRW